jgi:hypothetical protein
MRNGEDPERSAAVVGTPHGGAGIAVEWRIAEIGFDLMMHNVSGHEVEQRIIKKIPAWLLVYKGIRH